MPTVKPISDLQRNIGEIVRECSETKEPIYLTRNGAASLVVMDAAAFDEEMAMHDAVYEREGRVYNAIMRGIEDIKEGRVRPFSQALEGARRQRSAQHG